MHDVIALIEAICDTYDRADLQPLPDGTTYCNLAVISVAERLSCSGLGGKNADQIVDYIATSPEWSNVPIERTQDLANSGSLVIAGLRSDELGAAHGHVVVIRPGQACYSGKWGKVPRILNVGKENYIARAKSGPLKGTTVGINDAFIPMPQFFVWRPSLGAP